MNIVSTESTHTLEEKRYCVKLSFSRKDELKSFLRSNALATDEGCLIWKRGCHERGYGKIFIDHKMYSVHRISAHLYMNMPIDSKMCVCHKCDNPRCFRPSHLFIGTQKENMIDRSLKHNKKKIISGKKQ